MKTIEISLKGLKNEQGIERMLLDNNPAMKIGKVGDEVMVFSGLTILNLLEDCYRYKEQVNDGIIALAIFRAKMREEGLRLFPREINGKIAELAKKTGVPEKNLAEFFKGEIELLAEEVLGTLSKGVASKSAPSGSSDFRTR